MPTAQNALESRRGMLKNQEPNSRQPGIRKKQKKRRKITKKGHGSRWNGCWNRRGQGVGGKRTTLATRDTRERQERQDGGGDMKETVWKVQMRPEIDAARRNGEQIGRGGARSQARAWGYEIALGSERNGAELAKISWALSQIRGMAWEG